MLNDDKNTINKKRYISQIKITAPLVDIIEQHEPYAASVNLKASHLMINQNSSRNSFTHRSHSVQPG